MNRYLLTGGRLIDPAAGTDEVSDLLIEDGMVGAVYPLSRWREAVDHAFAAGSLGTVKVAFDPRRD